MKTILFGLGLLLMSGVALPAQIFRPETLQGALWGGLAGAVIGHNDDRRGWEGAAYGAAAGALVGTWIGEARDARGTQVPRPRHQPWLGYGPDRFHGYRHDVGYHHGLGYDQYHRSAGYYRHPVAYSDGRYHRSAREWRRGDYARTGLLLGGVLGAVIGHQDDRRGWEGAAYGAGAGLLLGTLADRRAERIEAERRLAEAERVQIEPAAAAPVTIINNYYGGERPASPMTSANGLFGR